jgi:hypothetical protein
LIRCTHSKSGNTILLCPSMCLLHIRCCRLGGVRIEGQEETSCSVISCSCLGHCHVETNLVDPWIKLCAAAPPCCKRQKGVECQPACLAEAMQYMTRPACNSNLDFLVQLAFEAQMHVSKFQQCRYGNLERERIGSPDKVNNTPEINVKRIGIAVLSG